MEISSFWLAVIPWALVVAYAIWGGVEFSLPLAGVLRSRRSSRRHGRYFAPVWESTNFFLLAALLSTTLIFPVAAVTLGPALRPLWAVIGILLAIRLILVMIHHYTRLDHASVHWLLLAVSWLLPVVLVQNATVLLTGDPNVFAHPGLAATLGALALALSVSLWGGYFYQPGRPTRQAARTGFWTAVPLATIVLPLAMWGEPVITDGRGVLSLTWPVYGATVAAVLVLMAEWRRRYFVAGAVMVTGAAVALFLAQLPYLWRPLIRLDEAASPLLTGGWFVTWLVAAILGYILSLWFVRVLIGNRD
jgi:hypothetical protein